MGYVTRYSAGFLDTDTTVPPFISSFELNWITPFWIPQTVLFDQSSSITEFPVYLSCLGINSRPKMYLLGDITRMLLNLNIELFEISI